MATITISFSLTDAKQVHLLKNLKEMAGRTLAANVDGYQLPYKIEPKTKDENDKQFGKRAMAEILLNTLKANALRTDRFRRVADEKALDPISENIPDDLLT